MGEHGMGGKSLLYDLASKIPCFVHDPTLLGEQRGREVDALVSSLDFPVTMLDYAGVEAPEFMDGRSLRPLVQGKTEAEIKWRSELFLESLYTGRDTPFQEGLRSGKWKYIRMFDGQKPSYNESHVDFAGREPEFEMLFNLEADPGETKNLVEAQEGSKILSTFREKVATQSEALNKRREAFKKVVEVTAR
jgi:arylsulfatase A-like enzyme